MLRTSMYVEDSLSKVKLPFFVLHGDADTVTDPEVSRALYERAASADKAIKLYAGMWHGLTAGEPDHNVDAIFSDIVAWLNGRSRTWTVEDRLMKMMASPDRFIRGERGGAADVDGDAKRGPPRRRGGCFSGLAGRTHHHSEM
jgi:acylglycerol lipase